MSQFHWTFVGVNIYFSHQCFITVTEIFVQNEITFQVLAKCDVAFLSLSSAPLCHSGTRYLDENYTDHLVLGLSCAALSQHTVTVFISFSILLHLSTARGRTLFL